MWSVGDGVAPLEVLLEHSQWVCKCGVCVVCVREMRGSGEGESVWVWCGKEKMRVWCVRTHTVGGLLSVPTFFFVFHFLLFAFCLFAFSFLFASFSEPNGYLGFFNLVLKWKCHVSACDWSTWPTVQILKIWTQRLCFISIPFFQFLNSFTTISNSINTLKHYQNTTQLSILNLIFSYSHFITIFVLHEQKNLYGSKKSSKWEGYG